MTYQQLAMAVDIMLEAWTGQPRYLAATRAGCPRVGLDGAPLGRVLREEEAGHATGGAQPFWMGRWSPALNRCVSSLCPHTLTR
jgi:hypothetical protein